MSLSRLRRRALIGLTAGAIAFVGIAAFVLSASNQRQNAAVTHTRMVLHQLNEVLASLVDAETGQRGFLITQDSVYLQPYIRGAARYPEAADSLRLLLAGSPTQRAKLDSIQELARQKLDEITATLELHRRGERPGALALIRTDAGVRLMDEIRRHAGDIDRFETGQLQAAAIRSDRLNTLTLALIGISAVVGVLLAALLGMVLSRAVSEQESLSLELSEKARVLEETASELEISKEELECSYEELQASNEELQATNEQLHESNVSLDESNRRLQISRGTLAESDRRHRAVLRAANAVVWRTDAAGRFVEPQPDWLEYTGQEPGDSLGFGWVAMLHPEDREAISKGWSAAVSKGRLYASAGRLYHARSGEYRHFDVIAAPIRDEHDSVSEWFGVIFDTNERVVTERKLHEESERRLLAVTTAGLGTFARDLGSDLVETDAAFRRLYGMPEDGPATLSAAQLRELVHPDDRASVSSALEYAIGADRDFAIEFRLETREGTRWLTARGRIAHDATGRPSRIYGVVGDITERRQVEVQLQQVERLGAIGRLAGGVAHEINNALTAGIGFCQFALRDLAPDHRARGDIEQVLRANERAATIAQQLLAFTRRQILRPQLFDPGEAISELEPMLQRVLGGDFGFAIDCAHGDAAVHMDRGQLEQVLINLVINARDALSVGGKVRIATSLVARDGHPRMLRLQPGEYVRISVSDNGYGMSEEVRRKAFEPFFTTKPVGKGTGLGLSTVYGIVQQSGGDILIESVPQEGTTVSVFLPAHPAAAPMTGETPAAARGNETILVVEDEPQVRELARRTLTSYGYTVETAADGMEALRCLSEQGENVHMVLSDVVMPGMNGHELAGRVRAEHPHVRLLFMSGYAGEDVVARGLVERGDPFIQKPYSPDALAKAVRNEFDRAGRGPS